MTNIHPTAIIDATARLHPTVQIGPYCIIEAEVAIGADCVLDSHVRIYRHTVLGCGNRICHGVTLGSEPQDLTFTAAKSRPLIIGDHNHFKEYVNISRGVKTEHGTHIGNHNYFMTFSHVGHDCQVGDYNILANTATLAGHVELAHYTFISGQVAVHQFCRIGSYVMVGGLTGVAQDIPPYLLVNGQRAHVIGQNNVGLRRNGFTQEQRNTIKKAYRLLYRSGLSQTLALTKMQTQFDTPEVAAIVTFIKQAKRGIVSHQQSKRRGSEINLLS